MRKLFVEHVHDGHERDPIEFPALEEERSKATSELDIPPVALFLALRVGGREPEV